ncbi:unnamed protein product [Amoebophrya sp. A120]|nr:unnamed protein product [Amoebophrya sp. A120]|eukprot:GSA120T00021712001.1
MPDKLKFLCDRHQDASQVCALISPDPGRYFPRRARMSKQFQVFDVGGDVFTLSVTIADGKVLQSTYFTPEEGIFLKEAIRNKKIDVVTGLNLQIYLRTVYDPATMATAKMYESGDVPMSQVAKARKSTKFVMFLPGWRTDENLTTSWCWMKFAPHLVKNNFNCIFLDLPGFSKSTVGSMSRCSPDKWKSFDVDVIRVVLETLKIPRVHLCSWGDSANMVLNCLKKIPKMLAVRHIMLAPILTGYDVDTVSKLLLQTANTVFLAHDPKTYGDKSREVIMFKVSDTLAIFEEIAKRSKLLAHQIKFGTLTASDLKRVILSESPDPGLPSVCGLVPSKYFLVYTCEFLSGTNVEVYNSQDLLGRLDYLERLKQHMRKQQDKMALMADKQMTDSQLAVFQRFQQQEQNFGAEAMMNVQHKETQDEKYKRLSFWKLKKTTPEYSFGVRVLERNLIDETENALATSLDEYLDTFGAEEDEFLRACDDSGTTYRKEAKDDRLTELRSRVEVDPMAQLASWQKAAEDSYHQFQMEQRTGLEDVQAAVATSRREVDLTSMLTEEERRSRPNNAPATVDPSTFYEPGAQYRWQEAQRRELAAKQEEEARQRLQASQAAPTAASVRDHADEAVRKAMLESAQLERRMNFVDRFSKLNQPQDLEDDELLSQALEKSKRETHGPGEPQPTGSPAASSLAASTSGPAVQFPGNSEHEDDVDDDIPHLDGSHTRMVPPSSANSSCANSSASSSSSSVRGWSKHGGRKSKTDVLGALGGAAQEFHQNPERNKDHAASSPYSGYFRGNISDISSKHSARKKEKSRERKVKADKSGTTGSSSGQFCHGAQQPSSSRSGPPGDRDGSADAIAPIRDQPSSGSAVSASTNSSSSSKETSSAPSEAWPPPPVAGLQLVDHPPVAVSLLDSNGEPTEAARRKRRKKKVQILAESPGTDGKSFRDASSLGASGRRSSLSRSGAVEPRRASTVFGRIQQSVMSLFRGGSRTRLEVHPT